MRLAYFLLLPVLPLLSQDAEVRAYVPHLTPLNRIQPVLPDAARAEGIDGTVRVLVTIDQQGLVTNAEALTGPAILRPPALDAIRQWKFRAVIREGHSVASYTDESAIFFIPGKRTPPAYDIAEMTSATQRLLAIQRKFPRSKEQELADLEQDSLSMSVLERYSALPRLSKTAWAAGDIDKARTYAEELLRDAEAHRDWNYGNAIHDGNMVMGLVALQAGNSAQASNFLIQSGKTAGSPQLNSFGPNMTLANVLLQKGEKDVVLEYFSLCRTFWTMGSAKLDEWSATVRGGGVPSFGANLFY